MKTTQEILTEIVMFVRTIETNYPEIYQHLDEDPMTIPNIKNPVVDNYELNNYLQTLKDIIKKYKGNH
jgi:hypothetical protein